MQEAAVMVNLTKSQIAHSFPQATCKTAPILLLIASTVRGMHGQPARPIVSPVVAGAPRLQLSGA